MWKKFKEYARTKVKGLALALKRGWAVVCVWTAALAEATLDLFGGS